MKFGSVCMEAAALLATPAEPARRRLLWPWALGSLALCAALSARPSSAPASLTQHAWGDDTAAATPDDGSRQPALADDATDGAGHSDSDDSARGRGDDGDGSGGDGGGGGGGGGGGKGGGNGQNPHAEHLQYAQWSSARAASHQPFVHSFVGVSNCEAGCEHALPRSCVRHSPVVIVGSCELSGSYWPTR